MFNKIAGFTLNSPDKANSLTETYIAQASSTKEKLAGKLFILSDLSGNHNDCKKLSNYIISTLSDLYYNDEKILLKEKLDKIKVENIFESALSQANEKIYDFVEEEKLIGKLESVNLLAGVIYNEEVYFSQCGSSQAFVLFKKNDRYELMSVGSNDEESIKLNFKEIFNSIVSGNVPPGSFFITSNEALAEYINTGVIKEIISVLPPIGAIEQIKNKLKEINNRVSFAGIIIKNNFGQIDAESSSASVANVQYSEEKTSNILSTAGFLSYKKLKTIINNLLVKLKPKKKDPRVVISTKKTEENNQTDQPKNKEEKIKKTKPKVINLKDKIIFGKKPSFFSSLKKLLPISYLRNKDNWHWTRKKLNKKNQAILIVVLILIVVFSVNLIIKDQRDKKIAQEQDYQEIISQIEQKQNQIDSYLLYKNEDSARILIQESLTLINSLDKEKANYKEYLNKYESQLEAIRHASSPKYTEIITLSQDASISSFGLSSEGLLYASDPINRKIYLVNPENNNLQNLDIPGESNLSLNFAVNDRYNNLYFLNENDFTQLLLPEKNIKSLGYELPANAGEISSAGNWYDNFYLFDKSVNQLYKYSKNNSTISFSNNWLTNPSDLDNLDISDIAIDGDIYFLSKKGEIKKFHTGNLTDFKIDLIEPNIEQAQNLIITKKHLYIFEPGANRLIKYEFLNEDREEVKFLQQFEINNLNDLQNIALSQDEKTAYLLANKKIYLLDLEPKE